MDYGIAFHPSSIDIVLSVSLCGLAVDIVFAHRPDPDAPMLEVVRAFNWLIQAGKAFYWATSEWSAEEIEEAHRMLLPRSYVCPIED